jgi:hypothetical protein
VGEWYWIGLVAGLGAALGVLLAGLLGFSRAGVVAAALVAGGGGLLIGLGIDDWDEAIAGAVGGLLGAAGAGQVVRGTLRRGGTRAATAVWFGLGALVLGALALIPGVGFVEAVVAPLLGARLRTRAPNKYAGLRSLAE